MIDTTPSEVEIIREAIAAQIDNVWTMLPAVVVDYDDASQTCTARLVCQRPIQDELGEVVYEEIPPIPNVPVQFPRCAGFELRFKLAPGDGLALVFSKWSFAEWRSGAKIPAKPGDTRSGSPGYPVALPGLFPSAAASAALGANLGRLGPVDGDTDGGATITFAPDGVKVGAGTWPVALAQQLSQALLGIDLAIQAAFTAQAGVDASAGLNAYNGARQPTELQADFFRSNNLKADK